MPISSGRFHDQQGKAIQNALAAQGPAFPVEVQVPLALAQYLSKQNTPLPAPSTGMALIDTGASRSCVDLSVISALGVQSVGQQTLRTAGGEITAPLFPAQFQFPTIGLTIDFGSVVGVDLRGQTAANFNIIVLIGRDLLSRGLFIYNGADAGFSLAF